ncbi:programmed cell death protein 2 isoform X2 [Apteryx mantelli]|uniref:Programmed cell death protein 2 isoform X2 n=1 Tax=Apteryx mantelli TaxID=2696672 RepID=A0ABM4E9W8_9AVES
MAAGVELGFAGAAAPGEAWRLRSAHFPSKVGGRPAWLGEAGLPGPAALRCGRCAQPCALLLQLYAPLPGRADAFHRSLFVFACRGAACYRPPGPRGPLRGDLEDAVPDHNEFLFPEYEILIEPEEPESPADSSVDPDDEEGAVDTSENSDKQEELRATGSANEALECLDEETLEAMAKHETEDDKIFQKFKERIAAEPEQIIRYCRGGEGPIWVSGENIPEEKDIPNCSCGAKRIFEFQIMPQLLNHLKVDSLGESIDWGTLAVYTCANNCNEGNQYTEEFIWKQDFSAGSM